MSTDAAGMPANPRYTQQLVGCEVSCSLLDGFALIAEQLPEGWVLLHKGTKRFLSRGLIAQLLATGHMIVISL